MGRLYHILPAGCKMKKYVDIVLVLLLVASLWRLGVNESHLSSLYVEQAKLTKRLETIEIKHGQLQAEVNMKTDPRYVQHEQLRMLEGFSDDPDQVRGYDGKFPRERGN